MRRLAYALCALSLLLGSLSQADEKHGEVKPTADAVKRHRLASEVIKNAGTMDFYKSLSSMKQPDVCRLARKTMEEYGKLEKPEKDRTEKDELADMEKMIRLNLLFLANQTLRLDAEIDQLKKAAAPEGKAWLKDAQIRLIAIKTASKKKVGDAATKLLTKPGDVPFFGDLVEVHRYADRAGDYEPSADEKKKASPVLAGSGGGYSKSKTGDGSYSKSKASGGSFSKSGGFESGSGISLDDLLGGISRESRIDWSMVELRRFPSWQCDAPRPEEAWMALINAVAPKDRAEMDKFLTATGVDPKKPFLNQPERDLSGKFHAPTCQGDTKACAAFAITSDLGTFPDVPPPSVALAYAYMVPDNFENRPPVVDNLRQSLASNGGLKEAQVSAALDIGVPSIEEALDRLVKNPIAPEKNFPMKADFLPISVNAIADRRYGVGKWTSTAAKPTAEALVRLIQAGKPPMLTMRSDARDVIEDWIRPKRGSMGHIINVVGYGTSIDPFDGQRKPYFMVRDSFTGDQGIHYRMAASELVDQATGMFKITEAKIATEAPTYPKGK